MGVSRNITSESLMFLAVLATMVLKHGLKTYNDSKDPFHGCQGMEFSHPIMDLVPLLVMFVPLFFLRCKKGNASERKSLERRLNFLLACASAVLLTGRVLENLIHRLEDIIPLGHGKQHGDAHGHDNDYGNDRSCENWDSLFNPVAYELSFSAAVLLMIMAHELWLYCCSGNEEDEVGGNKQRVAAFALHSFYNIITVFWAVVGMVIGANDSWVVQNLGNAAFCLLSFILLVYLLHVVSIDSFDELMLRRPKFLTQEYICKDIDVSFDDMSLADIDTKVYSIGHDKYKILLKGTVKNKIYHQDIDGQVERSISHDNCVAVVDLTKRQ